MASEARVSAFWMLVCVICLSMIGVIAGISVAPPGDAWSKLSLHCIHLALGLGSFMACFAFPVDKVRRVVPGAIMAVFAILILMLFGVIGYESHKAVRWIYVGPLSLQPSVLLQCLWPVALAGWAARDPLRLHQWREIAKMLAVFGLLLLPVLLQPDLGSVLILFGVSGITLLFAGAPVRFLRVLIPICLTILLLAIFAFPHVDSRITNFINQEPDYQQLRAEEAFAVGGLLGRGPGMGVMKYGSVPEGDTDYILALIAEEWGVPGTFLIWTLYVVFTLLGLRLARQTERRYGAILVASATLMISVQAALNMAVVTGAVPPKGLPLPFISRGGSSILALSALLGFALRAALLDRRASQPPEPFEPVEPQMPWTKSNVPA